MLDPIASSKSARIRDLNDRFRKTFVGGTVVVTAAFNALPAAAKATVLRKVREFDRFEPDNDPYLEHDMAFFDEAGERFFFKIDYYSPDMRHGSDDPTDTSRTRRVLTIGLAEDY